MKRREFYLHQNDFYNEVDIAASGIEKIYEIILKNEKTVELPTGCRQLRLVYDENDVHAQAVDTIVVAEKARLRVGQHCIGISLAPGVSIREEKIASLEDEWCHAVLSRPIPLKEKADALLPRFAGVLQPCGYPLSSILEELEAENGCMQILEIQEQYHVGKRWLQMEAKKGIGISLKKYAMILRIQVAMEMLRSGEDGVYLKLNFYDQAHFIKSFKNITCMTLQQFLRG